MIDPLSPQARARLAAFRERESPDDGAAARCLDALQRRVEAEARRPATGRRRVAVAVAALAAGVLLALAWAATASRRDGEVAIVAPYHATGEEASRPAEGAERRGAGRPRAQPVSPASGAIEHVPADSIDVNERSGSIEADPTDSIDVNERSGASEHAPADSKEMNEGSGSIEHVQTDSMETDGEAGAHARAHRRGAAMRGPRPRSEEAIVAEVDLLRRAKLAGPAARLELLAEHARRFPAGILAAERVLLEIEARCALGETAAARALAGRFARRFPGSPLSERATTACGEDPETERAEGGHGN